MKIQALVVAAAVLVTGQSALAEDLSPDAQKKIMELANQRAATGKAPCSRDWKEVETLNSAKHQENQRRAARESSRAAYKRFVVAATTKYRPPAISNCDNIVGTAKADLNRLVFQMQDAEARSGNGQVNDQYLIGTYRAIEQQSDVYLKQLRYLGCTQG